ncbi:zinc metallopeptidase [Bellilinea caldifistulae]|uniref:Zinc metallopeptidase n=1 Tax=Bellilinea caldifistulae TaxID=360411 RepID=A0A0P6XRK6_9CHLR|nr:zinc metallopeptidase [Bellilinea caldifistulae]
MFGGYGLYILFSLPALILGFWAQIRVQSAFNKYSRVRTYAGLSGAQIARRMLDSVGLSNVRVEQSHGFLSDHYDPRAKVLRLSPQVYQSNSVAAAGVAAHEAGHAIQDASGYAMLQLRTALVPGVQLGSWLGPIIFIIGFFLSPTIGTSIAWLGIGLFALAAVFALVTLPVEFDASRRAKAWLSTSGAIYNEEIRGVNSVLDAAALTYVAAAVQAISTILYYVFLLTGRNRD